MLGHIVISGFFLLAGAWALYGLADCLILFNRRFKAIWGGQYPEHAPEHCPERSIRQKPVPVSYPVSLPVHLMKKRFPAGSAVTFQHRKMVRHAN